MSYIELTAEQRQRYIEQGGVFCPVCDSENIESLLSDDGGTHSIMFDSECEDCRATWVDEYTLARISNVEDNRDDD